MSIFEKMCAGLQHTSLGYYLAVFIFEHKLWKLCHRVNDGWVFLGRFHPDDGRFFLKNSVDRG